MFTCFCSCDFDNIQTIINMFDSSVYNFNYIDEQTSGKEHKTIETSIPTRKKDARGKLGCGNPFNGTISLKTYSVISANTALTVISEVNSMQLQLSEMCTMCCIMIT